MVREIDEVAKTGRVEDWPALRSLILSHFWKDNSGSPDVSPSSTVLVPWAELNVISTADQMREYLMESIQAMNSPPICIQRLCEVISMQEDNLNERKRLMQIERIIASSRSLKPGSSIRRRSSRGTTSDGSLSPTRRISSIAFY